MRKNILLQCGNVGTEIAVFHENMDDVQVSSNKYQRVISTKGAKTVIKRWENVIKYDTISSYSSFVERPSTFGI